MEPKTKTKTTVELDEKTARAIEARARRAGVSLEAYLTVALEAYAVYYTAQEEKFGAVHHKVTA